MSKIKWVERPQEVLDQLKQEAAGTSGKLGDNKVTETMIKQAAGELIKLS